MKGIPKFDRHPILYVVGRSFEPAHDGQAKRLDIVTRFIELEWADRPRYLLSPVLPFDHEKLRARGWSWLELPVTGSIRSDAYRKVSRLWTLLAWRCFGLYSDEALSLIAGTAVRFGPGTARLFRRFEGASVLVGRCEFAGLVNFRTVGSRWVLDSNDSLTNLERVYERPCSKNYRRWLGLSKECWLARIEKAEMQFAAKYDRVINICAEDRRFYANAIGENSVLEDTDIVNDGDHTGGASEFDVGYIGGSHEGAIAAAKNILTLAKGRNVHMLRFGIAGAVCGALRNMAIPENARLVGRVPDAVSFLRRCRVVVIFSEMETGASVKFQEALASGVTVIANSRAARYSLAAAGRTHIEVQTLDDVASALLSGAAFRFRPLDLRAHFTMDAFVNRFKVALNW